MDLFEVFPQFKTQKLAPLAGQELRLISLSAIVYDDQAFYFEISQPRYWGRLPEGQFSIGVGAPKVSPDEMIPPSTPLLRYLRRQWRCEVTLVAPGNTYVLDLARETTLLPEAGPGLPYLLILNPPKLGGANVPDALVQAVYLMPVTAWRSTLRRVSLFTVDRAAIGEFLKIDEWLLADLKAQPWADFQTRIDLPEDAFVRPVLALRRLQHLWATDVLPPTLLP